MAIESSVKNFGGHANSIERSKRFHRGYRRKEKLLNPIAAGLGHTRKETEHRRAELQRGGLGTFSFHLDAFHAKSRLRDKTPRGKQLVHALTEVGKLFWQKTARAPRKRGCQDWPPSSL
jgi:hypothetical protein